MANDFSDESGVDTLPESIPVGGLPEESAPIPYPQAPGFWDEVRQAQATPFGLGTVAMASRLYNQLQGRTGELYNQIPAPIRKGVDVISEAEPTRFAGRILRGLRHGDIRAGWEPEEPRPKTGAEYLGTGLARAGGALAGIGQDNAYAAMKMGAAIAGQDQGLAKLLGLDQGLPDPQSWHENFTAGIEGEETPFMKRIKNAPWYVQAPFKVQEGINKMAPALALSYVTKGAGIPAIVADVFAFGLTPEGFNPIEGAIMGAMPGVSKIGEEAWMAGLKSIWKDMPKAAEPYMKTVGQLASAQAYLESLNLPQTWEQIKQGDYKGMALGMAERFGINLAFGMAALPGIWGQQNQERMIQEEASRRFSQYVAQNKPIQDMVDSIMATGSKVSEKPPVERIFQPATSEPEVSALGTELARQEIERRKYASTVREDKGQLPTEGQVPEAGEKAGGYDVEQKPPVQHQPVGERARIPGEAPERKASWLQAFLNPQATTEQADAFSNEWLKAKPTPGRVRTANALKAFEDQGTISPQTRIDLMKVMGEMGQIPEVVQFAQSKSPGGALVLEESRPALRRVHALANLQGVVDDISKTDPVFKGFQVQPLFALLHDLGHVSEAILYQQQGSGGVWLTKNHEFENWLDSKLTPEEKAQGINPLKSQAVHDILMDGLFKGTNPKAFQSHYDYITSNPRELFAHLFMEYALRRTIGLKPVEGGLANTMRMVWDKVKDLFYQMIGRQGAMRRYAEGGSLGGIQEMLRRAFEGDRPLEEIMADTQADLQTYRKEIETGQIPYGTAEAKAEQLKAAAVEPRARAAYGRMEEAGRQLRGATAPTDDMVAVLQRRGLGARVGNTIIVAPDALGAVTAYHGTGAERFDRFLLRYLGTGEGAMAYGWGLYFAQQKKVAEKYAEKLGTENFVVDGKPYRPTSGSAEESALDYVATAGYEAAIKQASDMLGEADRTGDKDNWRYWEEFYKHTEALKGKKVEAKMGDVYTVSINANDDEMIDWDRPFSQQSQKVQKALSVLGKPATMTLFGKTVVSFAERTGEEIYNNIVASQRKNNVRESMMFASLRLERMGIKGIRYRDQHSRQQEFIARATTANELTAHNWKIENSTTGDVVGHADTREQAERIVNAFNLEASKNATYNYVIFNEDDIQITHVNGQSIPAHEVVQSQARGATAASFVSPNVEEGTDLDYALKELSGPRQKALNGFMGRVLTRLGFKGKVLDGVGDWQDGAENTTVTEIQSPMDFDQVRVLSALGGLAARQKAVIPFRFGPGPDRLYDFFLQGSVEDARALLQKHGILFRTIVPVEGGNRIFVFDPGSELVQNIEQLAHESSTSIRRTEGQGEFLGGEDREKAALEFQRIVAGRVEAPAGGLQRGPTGGPVGGYSRALTELADEARSAIPLGARAERGDRLGRERGKAVPGLVTITHWSNQPDLTVLDPKFHGTGIAGTEAQRKRDYPEIYLNRIYFGVRGYKSEGNLGREKYTTVLMFPSNQLDALANAMQGLELMGVTVIPFQEWPDKGMLHHEFLEMTASKYCEADAILHWDSDYVATAPITPDTFVKHGKPVMIYASYEWLIKQNPNLINWQRACEAALGYAPRYEFMRRPGLCHVRKVYPKAVEEVEGYTKVPLESYIKSCQNSFPQTFAEYPLLGEIAWTHFHHLYHWVNQETEPFPHVPIQQFWGHGSMDQPQNIWVGGEQKVIVPRAFCKSLEL